jgi:D-lactate dehydrogenase (cytochrome)
MFSDLKDPVLYKTVFDRLISILGKSGVSVENLEIERHAQVLLKTIDGQEPFNIIAFPSNNKQISEIVKLAGSKRVPIVAYGGGTSFQGLVNPHYIPFMSCLLN